MFSRFRSATEPQSRREASGSRRRRRRGLIAAAATLALVATGGAIAAANHKTIQLDVNGETVEVSTFTRDIEGLLVDQGITVAEHDLVVPAPHEPLRDGTDVVVRTAQQIDVQVEGQYRTVWTTALSADEALTHLTASGRDASLTASRSGERTELALPVTDGGTVHVDVDDDRRVVQATGPVDLDAVLLLAEVSLNPADRIELQVDTKGVPTLTVTRVETDRGTRTEAIEHESIERETGDLYIGQSRVVQEGSDGERTFTFARVLVDGEVESSKRVGSDVTTEPEDRIVEVGTAERPPPPPPPSSSSSSSGSGSGSSGSGSSGSGSSSGSGGSSGSGDSGSSGGSGGGAPSSGVWAALAQCESGGNPQAVSPSGTYHGLYQFSVATWQSVGGSGLPSQASPAEQTQRAQALQARSGWGQWPHCSSVLGLR